MTSDPETVADLITRLSEAKEGSRATEAMLSWLSRYRDGRQNNRAYPNNTMWTKRNGASFRGLRACQAAGFIVSRPDATISENGWRHDITETGRAALQSLSGEGK